MSLLGNAWPRRWGGRYGADVMLTLQYLFAVRGAPEHVRSDNGPEFIAKELQRWLNRAAVGTLYIQKASPWETAMSRVLTASCGTNS